MKVLIADDDRDQLAIRELLLTHLGFETVSASNRESAMQVAVSERPVCAIVDLRLPTEESGLGLIRELKQSDPALSIFVLTGGNVNQLDHTPERLLIDGVFRKGAASGPLIQRLKKIQAAAH